MNTNTAATLLSSYVATLTGIAIAKRTVPRQRLGEGLTYKNLAILKLKKREKVQGALDVLTAFSSMYLFSVLGVHGKENEMVWWLGVVGMVALLVAIIIEGTFLASIRSRGERGLTGATGVGGGASARTLGEGTVEMNSKRQLSIGRVGDDMVVAGLV